MKHNLFTYLPSEIIIDILSRLPVRTIIICKCVCKSWHGLLKTQEFVESHVSKALPCLHTCQIPSKLSYQYMSILHFFFEFQDGHNIEEVFYYNPATKFTATKFTLPFHGWIGGSANGLLFMYGGRSQSLYICNHITRDYIELKSPHEFDYSGSQAITYGFGVSKITGQFKLVQVFQNYRGIQDSLVGISKHGPECHVYTIGTGSWRRVTPVAPLYYPHGVEGAFVNGNLHWLVADLLVADSVWISCFDLETELFSTFSQPLPFNENLRLSTTLTALWDCLCLCYNNFDVIEIWLMKEYGVEKSWTKEFVIPRKFDGLDDWETDGDFIRIVNVFKNGDILMELCDLFYYSKEKNTIEMVDLYDPYEYNVSSSKITFHVPSFVSLKNFEEMENVRSL